MINFRYHVVSVVAVFLALGLGVLVGSSFIAEGTVKFLEATQRRLEDTNDNLKNDNGDLEDRVDALSGFAEAGRDSLVKSVLQNRPVLVVRFDGTPDEVIQEVVLTLQKAGARIDGIYRFSDNLDGSSDSRRRQIALALESSATDPALHTTLVDRLAATLSGQTPGMLQRLLTAGLAEQESVEGVEARPPAEVASAGTAIVLVNGEPDGEDGLETQFSLPLIRALSLTTVVAVGEVGSDVMEVAGPLREDPELKVVTVDGVNSPVGQAALVLGVQGALNGRFGHYGSGKGASSLLPPALE